MGIILTEHIEQQRSRGLKMPGLGMFSRKTLEAQPSHHRNIPELSPGPLRTIHTALDIRSQILRAEQLVNIRIVYRNGLIAQQLETIVIHRKGKTDRCRPADPVSQQRRHRLVDEPPFERIDE